MNARRQFSGLTLSVLCLAAASPAFGLANRVFVSARSGNNANPCDNINTPCQTFTGALAQLNPGGEAIVLDSGGYGSVTITQGVTIEAPAGVTAFIHPPSGDAITINAPGGATVTLRGRTLNVGTNNGVTVNSVGTLNVENCLITGFANDGLQMNSAGQLNMKGTDIKGCDVGLLLVNHSGLVQASLDHCHLDGNGFGYAAATTSPGGSTTTASYSTANHNTFGWNCGDGTNGQDVLNLEFCTGSENIAEGLAAASLNAQSAARYSNCAFANNGGFGVKNFNNVGSLATRGNNTITGNFSGPTAGTIDTFFPM